jgi:hypothetical protein
MKMAFQLKSTLRLGAALMALSLMSTPLGAQWSKIPMTGIPLTADGKPNLSAPAPRLPDGTPDLSGIWQRDTNRLVKDLAADFKTEDFPFQPWAKALFDQRADGSHAREDPDANCLPLGVPKTAASIFPWKIVQTPGFIVIVHEEKNLWRQIFLDGRELMPDATPTWMGYSTGKWEGDTLVVDTKGFNGKAWLDALGRPSTDALHIIERYRRKDFGHMDIEITIDDAKAYTKPWTVTLPAHLLPDTELMEFICNENNRFLEHLPSK